MSYAPIGNAFPVYIIDRQLRVIVIGFAMDGVRNVISSWIRKNGQAENRWGRNIFHRNDRVDRITRSENFGIASTLVAPIRKEVSIGQCHAQKIISFYDRDHGRLLGADLVVRIQEGASTIQRQRSVDLNIG